MDNAFIQIVHLSAQKLLMALLGISTWVQEGALSLIIKVFVLSLLWENIHHSTKYTSTHIYAHF